ncbi:MAG: hypothetical protein OXB96_00715 [Candidatus Kaiserbacteria bacterium]|nr:hypothetical protein [Candidatus Kaiserbacteria bacterium]
MGVIKNDMRYLKIKNDQGFYWDGKEDREIDKINKDDLLKLLNAAETDEFSMDPYDDSLIKNKAHQIIYENIHSKITQFLDEKDQFKNQVDGLYKEAIRKYSADVQNKETDDIGNLEDENESAD